MYITVTLGHLMRNNMRLRIYSAHVVYVAIAVSVLNKSLTIILDMTTTFMKLLNPNFHAYYVFTDAPQELS